MVLWLLLDDLMVYGDFGLFGFGVRVLFLFLWKVVLMGWIGGR